MKILVTNDDGINAEGLRYLVDFAKKLGDVIVVSPKFEQSAMSHALKIVEPFECIKVDKGFGVDTYSVDSTPADCVRYAHYGLEEKIDVVLSGINRGYNLGEDIMYSGTVAAACEAATLGIKSFAISTGREGYIDCEKYIDYIYTFIVESKLDSLWNLYNINFPSVSFDNQKILITKQGDCNFQTTFELKGNVYYQMGVPCFENSKDKLYLDTSAIMNGYISITPLVYNRTNFEIYKNLIKNKYK